MAKRNDIVLVNGEQITTDDIRSKIYVIHGIPVMFDFDLAKLYNIETKVLKQAVRRNLDSFPEDFMFVLSNKEANELIFGGRSQIVTPPGYNIGITTPYVFTEAGVSMLSAILRSSAAVATRIQIMRAFVAMHQYLVQNAQVFQRLDRVEMTQLQQGEQLQQALGKINVLFDKMEQKALSPIQGVFYEGQVYSARRFVEDLVQKARREIVLVDTYVNSVVLDILDERAEGVAATIYTDKISSALRQDEALYFAQNKRHVTLKEYKTNFHDRFLIIDDDLYHFGASFKDLGKRLFAFDKMNIDKTIILNQL